MLNRLGLFSSCRLRRRAFGREQARAEEVDEDLHLWREMSARRPDQIELTGSMEVIDEQGHEFARSQSRSREEVGHTADADMIGEVTRACQSR